MTEPKWYSIARTYIGTLEIPGPRHNTTISRWLAKLGAWWFDDETPWCGTFAAFCIREAGYDIPKHWYRAKAWADYGALLRPDRLTTGAILVFDREGGGHVGFYVGESDKHYHVLGGNQSNGVNVVKIAKNRCIATRWPRGAAVTGKPVAMSAAGVVSTNEA